ncbi:hypothetical protein [Leptospira santarosai]|uniref:Uncharacterized protein n=1 Tax=Leptospira santarosai serovar Arenal str. MAVJ 401 TaxID=1049976 RepID=M6JT10_9LEPT|nr:hypothetical protein LEP1GSC063_1783 [Leptospira santarosai serovar Arenal str. MAVJ 401]
MKVVSFLRSFYRKKKLQLGAFNKIEKNVRISAFLNRSLNFETFRQKLWICFLIFLSFSSCKRGSFDRVKESSFQYLCKNYLLFCDRIVAKIDMFDCDPLHNLYERDGTHYIDREVLADNLVVEKEEKETDVFDPYSEKKPKKEKAKDTNADFGKNIRIDSRKLIRTFDTERGKKPSMANGGESIEEIRPCYPIKPQYDRE